MVLFHQKNDILSSVQPTQRGSVPDLQALLHSGDGRLADLQLRGHLQLKVRYLLLLLLYYTAIPSGQHPVVVSCYYYLTYICMVFWLHALH